MGILTDDHGLVTCYSCGERSDETQMYCCDDCGVYFCEDCSPNRDDDAPAEFCEACWAK